MLIYEFEIPDPAKPIPEDDQSMFGPTGELMPFHPELVEPDQVIGRKITEISCHLGTYGMGGYGFFGIRLENEWLVVSIFSAGNWLSVNGRMIEDSWHETEKRPMPWIDGEHDELSPLLIGQKISAFSITRTSLTIGFSNETKLVLDESPHARPEIEEGRKRIIEEEDDLRKAVFLCPTMEIWT